MTITDKEIENREPLIEPESYPHTDHNKDLHNKQVVSVVFPHCFQLNSPWHLVYVLLLPISYHQRLQNIYSGTRQVLNVRKCVVKILFLTHHLCFTC